jgi:glycosyltransferase involved in cell wall biosynthesis
MTNRMKNICYLVSSLARTGPTNQLSYIIKHLDREKFNPIIVTLFKESGKTLINRFIGDLEIKVICLNTSKIKALFFAKKDLKRIINDHKIDIIQTQGLLCDYISFKQLNNSYKKLSTIRNFPLDDYKNIFGEILGDFFAKKHINLISKNEKRVFACSKAISDRFKEEEGICLDYIQNGVDLEKFKPSVNKLDSKLKLGLTGKKTIFISVGSLIERKDFMTLIEAFKIFNKNDKAILLIAGEGKEKEKLKNESNSGIYFLGNVANIVEYLQASDCFVSSSLSEGLPNSVMEAMACSLPCILSDIESHKELRGEKKIGHIFFEKQNISDLSLKMEKSLHEINKLSEVSLKIIKEEFSAKIMSNVYQKHYWRCLE